MDYGVTSKGFVLKRFDTILEELQNDISEGLGFDVTQNPQSMLNSSLIVPFADRIAELWEVGQESYYAKYPTTAEGVNLDNACQYGNVFREGNEPTSYVIHVTGTEGSTENPTVIPKDTIIQSVTNPVVRLRCAKATVITREACNNIAIKPVVAIAGTYTIELNSELYSYTASAEDTVLDIMEGLIENFTADGYTAELSEESDYMIITDDSLSRVNEYRLTNNLTTKYVVCTIPYNTVDYGDIQLPKKTITSIVSNVEGLTSVINLIDPNPGQVQQTDAEFRKSYISKSYANAKTITNSVESYILDEVDDVLGVRCYENDQDEADSYGRPPHSIEAIVDGGTDLDVATAILATKAGGIQTFGDVLVNVVGKYGDEVPIRFNRPEPIYVWVKVELDRGSNSIDPEYESVVRDYILDNTSLTIGDSFLPQKYIHGIYDSLSGLMYCRITVATGAAATKPAAADFAEGNVIITQRQKAMISEGRIEVVLTS